MFRLHLELFYARRCIPSLLQNCSTLQFSVNLSEKLVAFMNFVLRLIDVDIYI